MKKLTVSPITDAHKQAFKLLIAELPKAVRVRSSAHINLLQEILGEVNILGDRRGSHWKLKRDEKPEATYKVSGTYVKPRWCTLEEAAEVINMDPSTITESLQRSYSRSAQFYVDNDCVTVTKKLD